MCLGVYAPGNKTGNMIVSGATSTVLPLASQLTTVPLEPGGTIHFTYTVTPTWQWIGN
jgi:hypothetical protein